MNKNYLNEYVNRIKVTYVSPEDTKWISNTCSLDIDEHFDNLAKQFSEVILDEVKGGYFDVFYEGKRIFAGDGPSLSKLSIQLVAKLEASVELDIYCMCSDESADG